MAADTNNIDDQAVHLIDDYQHKLDVLLGININPAVNNVSSSEIKQYIEEFGWHYFKWKPTECPNCYNDTLIRLQIYFKRKLKLNIMAKYELKAGIIFTIDGKLISNKNITDNFARKLLLQNPLLLKRFTQIPVNFEDDLKQYAQSNGLQYPENGFLNAFFNVNASNKSNEVKKYLKNTLAISDDAIEKALNPNAEVQEDDSQNEEVRQKRKYTRKNVETENNDESIEVTA